MADLKKHRDGRTDKQTLASYSFMRANLKAKNRIAVRCRLDFASQLTIIFQWLRARLPVPWHSNLVRPPTYHVGQTVSSCLARSNHRVHFRRAACWEIASQRGHCQKAEARSETQPDHGGAPQ